MRLQLFRAAVLGTTLLTTGCFRMTIQNGREPATEAALDDKWRSATLLDAVDIDVPVPLDLTCKEAGWATIKQRHTFTNWFVDAFLAGGLVYESTHVDVHCAKAGPVPIAAPATPDRSL